MITGLLLRVEGTDRSKVIFVKDVWKPTRVGIFMLWPGELVRECLVMLTRVHKMPNDSLRTQTLIFGNFKNFPIPDQVIGLTRQQY